MIISLARPVFLFAIALIAFSDVAVGATILREEVVTFGDAPVTSGDGWRLADRSGSLDDVMHRQAAFTDFPSDSAGRDVAAGQHDRRGTVASSGEALLPEPAMWIMLIGGFLLVGLTLRRRKTSLSFS